MIQENKEELIQEFREILEMDDHDHNEINNRLAEIIKNVRKSYAVGRDDWPA